jgi:hypothetical protein
MPSSKETKVDSSMIFGRPNVCFKLYRAENNIVSMGVFSIGKIRKGHVKPVLEKETYQNEVYILLDRVRNSNRFNEQY